MDDELNLLHIKEFVNAWIVGSRDELGPIALKVMDTSDSSLILEANGKLLQIIIPSSFQMEECSPDAHVSSDEVFLVTMLDSRSDRIFENILTSLNEKLERIKVQSGALVEVLDHLLLAMQKFDGQGQKVHKRNKDLSVNCMMSSSGNISNKDINVQQEVLVGACELLQSDDSMAASQNDSEDEVFPDAHDEEAVSCDNAHRSSCLQNCPSGFLFLMAEDAKRMCENAQKNSDKMMHLDSTTDDCMTYYGVLQWCDVNLDFKLPVIHLVIRIDGIVRNESVAAALGFSLDLPVKLFLQFGKELWLQEDYNLSSPPLKPETLHVTQETHSFQKVLMAGFDEGIQGVRQSHHYGTEVLLPELVRIYFHFLAHRTAPTVYKLENSDLLSELQQFSAMENRIVGLLCFLSARFRSLPDWCVVCWNSLPYSVCRLRTCDREFCLFRFEELGLGTPVLQEVRNFPELIDLEISLATAAAYSNRDVFEPFPAFLLEKEEIRGRSGWFSKKTKFDNSATTNKTSSRSHTLHLQCNKHLINQDFYINKNLKMLRQVLQSYPPLEVMKGCTDEVTLKETLTTFWHKSQRSDAQNVTGKNQNKSDSSSEWTKKQWLPYDVLRFVLLTNRLMLYPLKNDKILDFVECHEFAVLHDSPEREAQFQLRRSEQGGSFFAFHGSPADNWYSILRNGLRCLSNTSYMSSGAANGTGIYLASYLSDSMSYCRSTVPGWGHGFFGDNFSVLAICEVINGAVKLNAIPGSGSAFLAFKKPGTSSGMSQMPLRMVVSPEHERDVLIRYICVFKSFFDTDCIGFKGKQPWMDISFISNTTLCNGIDLLMHFQNLRSKYSVKQREQQQACKEPQCQSVSVRPQKEELEDLGAVDSLLAMPDHISLSGRTKPEVELSQNTRKKHAACKREVVPAASAMQAISKEYKNIMKQISAAGQRELQPAEEDLPIVAGIQISIPHESNLCLWHVSLSPRLFKRFPLYKDLTECARQRHVQEVPIEMEFNFPPTYPFAPPFARVISPRFSFHTGHVTVGGSICMELLTVSGWSPACSFESVIVQIVNAMIEGGGRIDRTTWSSRTEYSENEAREAFTRVAQTHGWV